MKILQMSGIAIAVVLLAACNTVPQKYTWGNYENSLYSFYKDPSKSAELAVQLEAAILDAENTNKPLAPGIYAEYGYLLMQQGKSKEAIALFEKEKSKWPESTQLMNSMIQLAAQPAKVATAPKE